MMGIRTATWLGTKDRFARLRAIEKLDLAAEFREITQLFYADFQSVMISKGFDGLLFTYAAPRISAVLASSGELERRVLKRIVDTSLLASAVMEHGLKHETGRDAARRVNAMHSRYDIDPEDFVAVGAEEALGSLHLAERYGWRPVTSKEREALRLFYSQQARAFGSPRSLPSTVEELEMFFTTYLDRELHFEERNARLASALIDVYKTLVPRPFGRMFCYVLIGAADPRVLRACGIPVPSAIHRGISKTFLRLNGRKDPVPDGRPNSLEAMARRVYPDGWTIAELGTHTGDEALGAGADVRRSKASAL